MTIIVKAVPGLTDRELIEALGVPARQLRSAHGGFVVDERTALRFLAAYVAAVDQIANPTPPPTPPVPAPVVAMTPVPPAVTQAAPPTARERASRRRRG